MNGSMENRTAQHSPKMKSTAGGAARKFPFEDTFSEQSNWTRFLSVALFLCGAGFCLGGFAALMFDPGVALFFLVFSVYSIILGALLLKVSKSLTQYLSSHTLGNLQIAVRALKSFFRFLGISIVLLFVFSITAIIIFIAVR